MGTRLDRMMAAAAHAQSQSRDSREWANSIETALEMERQLLKWEALHINSAVTETVELLSFTPADPSPGSVFLMPSPDVHLSVEPLLTPITGWAVVRRLGENATSIRPSFVIPERAEQIVEDCRYRIAGLVLNNMADAAKQAAYRRANEAYRQYCVDHVVQFVLTPILRQRSCVKVDAILRQVRNETPWLGARAKYGAAGSDQLVHDALAKMVEAGQLVYPPDCLQQEEISWLGGPVD